jgi:hypothetical protein
MIMNKIDLKDKVAVVNGAVYDLTGGRTTY